MRITAQMQRFISAEPATLEDYDLPTVILSFGDEESRVLDFALPLGDIRDLVVQALASLASHGDTLAESILEEYFSDAS